MKLRINSIMTLTLVPIGICIKFQSGLWFQNYEFCGMRLISGINSERSRVGILARNHRLGNKQKIDSDSLDIITFPNVDIFSINLQSTDIWFSGKITQIMLSWNYRSKSHRVPFLEFYQFINACMNSFNKRLLH